MAMMAGSGPVAAAPLPDGALTDPPRAAAGRRL